VSELSSIHFWKIQAAVWISEAKSAWWLWDSLMIFLAASAGEGKTSATHTARVTIRNMRLASRFI
jgi:hypothetical protein